MPRAKNNKGGKRRFLLRNTRLRNRKQVNPKLANILKPSEDDIFRMLAAQVHIGRRAAHVNMKRYVWKRRADGFHIINLEKTWAKLILAARIIASVKDPKDVMVLSSRTFGQRGAIKFAHYTGATPMVGKWQPGTFTNPRNKVFEEPRLIIVDDPNTCFLALRETSYIGIPVIAFGGVHNNTRFIDCAIPCNNRGRLSVGLMFWLLAREVSRIRGAISRDKPWDVSVDLFFYRDANKVLLSQEKQKKKDEGQGDDAQVDSGYDGANQEVNEFDGYHLPQGGNDGFQDFQQPPEDYEQPPNLENWGANEFDVAAQGAVYQPQGAVQAAPQDQDFGQGYYYQQPNQGFQ